MPSRHQMAIITKKRTVKAGVTETEVTLSLRAPFWWQAYDNADIPKDNESESQQNAIFPADLKAKFIEARKVTIDETVSTITTMPLILFAQNFFAEETVECFHRIKRNKPKENRKQENYHVPFINRA